MLPGSLLPSAPLITDVLEQGTIKDARPGSTSMNLNEWDIFFITALLV
jgi:hypothetical protein